MRRLKAVVVFAVVVSAVVGFGGKWAEAQVQHVVGGDRGWDPSSGLDSWASDKVFRVGDRIWFAYSAAQGGVAEVGSREEFDACNVSNPIRMYTDGLDNVPLDAEGSLFFASTNPEHCNNGLKLNVKVLPLTYPGAGILQVTASEEHESIVAIDVAAGPTPPSGSGRLSARCVVFALAFLSIVVGYF